MKTIFRTTFVILCVGLAFCFSGCGGGGGDGWFDSSGINQIAVRSTGSSGNIRADLRPAAVAVPAAAMVALYQNGLLIAGPQAMGSNGVVFTGLADGTFSVRVTAGGRVFQTTKTLSSTRTALVAQLTYFAANGIAIRIQEAVDKDGDGFIGAGESVVKTEFSAGALTEATVGDAIDVTNWSGVLLADKDGDGVPNGFDEDVDGDKIANSTDPDVDGDGIPNGSDPDIDGDGVSNGNDTQPSGAGTAVVLLPAPGGFQSAGFPAVTTTLTIPGFASPKKSTLILVNTTGSSQVVSVAANGSGIVASIGPLQANRAARPAPTPGHKFHSWLREVGRSLPAFQATPGVRKSIRASTTTIGTTLAFHNPWDNTTVTAILKNKASQPNSTTGHLEHWVSNQITGADLAALLGHIDQVNALWGGANGMYQKIRAAFGNEPPAGDFNGLNLTEDIAVLWLPPNSNVAGFFYSNDLYSSGTSNRRKMFYMHFDKGPEALENYGSTFAHEFQHMINFYQRKLKDKNEEAWLDEAMSGYAEHVAGYTIVSGKNASKARLVQIFFNGVESNPLTSWVDGSYEDYGQVFMFALWLAEKYGTSGTVVKKLLTQTSVGAAAVAEFTGKAFKEVLTEWLLALYINDISGSSKYGYKGFNLNATYSGETLTGPSLKKPGQITVAPNAAAYVSVAGPSVATTLTWSVPTTLSVFELNK